MNLYFLHLNSGNFLSLPRVGFAILATALLPAFAEELRPHIQIRGVYGGNPTGLLEPGSLDELGLNVVFMNSRRITTETVAALKQQGAKVFAEFNTMHTASFS